MWGKGILEWSQLCTSLVNSQKSGDSVRDAISGAMTLQIIVIFMIIINCYLAFSVNYTKAFRVKNEIRSIIEKNEGLTCSAVEQINDLMLRTNYKITTEFEDWCTNNGYEVARLNAGSFCYKYQAVDVSGTYKEDNRYKGAYYTVATFVNIDLPLLNNFLPFAGNLFLVKGETALIYSSGVIGSGLPTGCATEQNRVKL